MTVKVFMMLFFSVLLALTSVTQAVDIEWVTVGNAGNSDDDSGYGGVGEEYRIGKYEITASQYTEFLNAVAATDKYKLYDTNMGSDNGCKIQRSGSSGSYKYCVASDYAKRPVNYVSWLDSLRFANWLHNGQGTGNTEDGAYDMSLGEKVVRKAGAKIWLPSEDEWYKAAYHKNDGVTGNYFKYPTSSDSVPINNLVEPTDPGNNATFWKVDYTLGYPYWRTEVGAHENSVSPYGAFDMGGNVMEWNEAIAGDRRSTRGGSYGDYDSEMSSSYRFGYNWDRNSSTTGFRFVSAAVPVASK